MGGDILQFLKDREGRINLAFRVTGTASSPVLRLDAEAQKEAARNALEAKANEAKRRLEDELKKKVEEELKKLFKRP